MITLKQAKKLSHGDIIHQNAGRNADGTCIRWRVSGEIKLWKTRPTAFRIPLKHGMYNYGEITHKTADYFHIPSSSNSGCSDYAGLRDSKDC